jgi:hypothetical protein
MPADAGLPATVASQMLLEFLLLLSSLLLLVFLLLLIANLIMAPVIYLVSFHTGPHSVRILYNETY